MPGGVSLSRWRSQTVTTTSKDEKFDHTELPKNKYYEFIVTETNAAGCSSSREMQYAL